MCGKPGPGTQKSRAPLSTVEGGGWQGAWGAEEPGGPGSLGGRGAWGARGPRGPGGLGSWGA